MISHNVTECLLAVSVSSIVDYKTYISVMDAIPTTPAIQLQTCLNFYAYTI